ncbi:MAG: indolepyruvate ferredoxin oxidoreductase family protein, partial [Anaerolineae bacterium]|nr:indolepyruvate ferredoxin oxidoreductase family protein [Anaerolineae bacterium]
EPGVIREFASGLDEVFVVEEKRAFIETFIRDALYPLPDRPRVIGKRDARDQMLVPAYGELDSDRVAQLLAPWLKQRLPADVIDHRLAAIDGAAVPIDIPVLARTPHFCSGCSHNRSTLLPEGSIAGGGIGCHTLAMLMDRSTYGVTQMGGEGAQWVGASPFSDMPHLFQNVGDGTFFHSGSLAVRQAVAAGVNITYKLLYNSAVGMTGGQDADGAVDVPAVTRALRAEGVTSIIVMSDHPDKYRAEASWADRVDIWHRDRLDEAQRRLRDTPGVTVLIYDQHCMAELRRMRRRGTAPEPPARIYINEAVCEGCGDCGVKSNCLSVFPVETEFGRKTQIHQSSCNKDYSCADGDCPAFLSIIPGETSRRRKTIAFNVDTPLPEPPRRETGSGNIYMMGIGGTGVVTVNQVLGVAALLDGKHIEGLDQTGLSQKGGSVVSHLKIMDAPHDTSNMIMSGEADSYLVFDILTGIAPNNLRRAAGEKTLAVISTSQIPTGAMVRKTDVHFPPIDALTTALDRHTRAQDNVYLDADALAEMLFGSHLPANIIVLGAAYQAGGLPVSADSIERSIALNGVAVAMNTQAFRVGRRLVAEPEWAQSLTAAPAEPSDAPPLSTEASAEAHALIDETAVGESVRALLKIRIPELIAYQNLAYARQYAAFVRRVWQAEQTVMPGESQLTEAVARYLFKLMAFKDEYEVARLHLRLVRSNALDDAFGSGAQATYLLHPPFLRALGVRRKIRLGRWFDPVYTLLVAMRRLRGTPLDLFGYTAVRRAERRLIHDYRALIENALTQLSAESYAQVVRVAALPDIIRGYEDIKLGSVRRFWDEVRKLGFAD